MKIGLFGTYNTSDTGPSRVTTGLATGLRRRGHDVVLFAHGDRTDPPHEDIQVEHLGPTPEGVSEMRELNRSTDRLAKDLGCDFVHPLEEYSHRTPVRTVQWTSGVYERWKRAPRDFAGYRSFAGDVLLNAMNRIGSSRSDCVVASSPETARQMREYWRLEPDEIIPLGVNEEVLTPPSTTDEACRVLVPGRLTQKKGQRDVLSRLDPDAEYTVDIVGGVADEAYYEELSAWHHRCHGFVSRDRLHEFYRQADVVVVPSRHENFSMTALEGIAHGAVVVVTQQCGFAQFEWATRDNGIYVVENGSKAAPVVESLSQRDLSTKQRAAYELATTLTWTDIAERYDRLYREVVEP